VLDAEGKVLSGVPKGRKAHDMIKWLIGKLYGKTITCPECGGSAEEDTDGTITCPECGYVAIA